MTLHAGYALAAHESLDELDMGGGSVLSLKVTGAQSNGIVTVIGGEVTSGGPPLHLHEAEDEVVICLEGRLTFQVGEERGVLESGGLVWFPRQVPHAVANLSDAVCRFLTVVTPSGIEDFFEAQHRYLSGLGPETPFDPDAFGAVAGSRLRPVVGPPLS
jgi:quercetin dioxygenase-like cupin family protein